MVYIGTRVGLLCEIRTGILAAGEKIQRRVETGCRMLFEEGNFFSLSFIGRVIRLGVC